jgi:hypothetical protein
VIEKTGGWRILSHVLDRKLTLGGGWRTLNHVSDLKLKLGAAPFDQREAQLCGS